MYSRRPPSEAGSSSAGSSSAGNHSIVDHARTARNDFPQWMCSYKCGIYYQRFATVPSSPHSSLPPYAVEQVSKILREEAGPAPKFVVDSTSHIGADTANFRQTWPDAKILAVESDDDVYKALRENMGNIGRILGRKRDDPPRPVEVRHADGAAVLAGLDERPDLIYFDVPWGGKEYSKVPVGEFRLQMSGQPLGAVVGTALRDCTPLAAVKLPFNIDMVDFLAEVEKALGRAPAVTSHDILKPKGDLCYRLVFLR